MYIVLKGFHWFFSTLKVVSLRMICKIEKKSTLIIKTTVKTATSLPMYEKNCSTFSAVKKVIVFYDRKLVSAYSKGYL